MANFDIVEQKLKITSEKMTVYFGKPLGVSVQLILPTPDKTRCFVLLDNSEVTRKKQIIHLVFGNPFKNLICVNQFGKVLWKAEPVLHMSSGYYVNIMWNSEFPDAGWEVLRDFFGEEEQLIAVSVHSLMVSINQKTGQIEKRHIFK